MVIRYIIYDYREIRKRIRECIRDLKKKKSLDERIAYIRFLKDINREIESHLEARKLLRKRVYANKH